MVLTIGEQAITGIKVKNDTTNLLDDLEKDNNSKGLKVHFAGGRLIGLDVKEDGTLIRTNPDFLNFINKFDVAQEISGINLGVKIDVKEKFLYKYITATARTTDGTNLSVGNLKSIIKIPFNGVIKRWDIVGDVPSSIELDIWKRNNAIPDNNTYSICGTVKPNLTSQQINSDLTLTGWTTAVAQDDIIVVNIESDSVDGCSGFTFTIQIEVV